MKRKATLLSSLLVLSLYLATGAPAQGWTWVHGRIPTGTGHGEFMTFVRRIHAYYQGRRLHVGRLVAEGDLEGRPRGRVVFIGPLASFRHPEWFGLPLKVLGKGKVTIGDRTFARAGTGIFLRSADRKRCLFTGLGMKGFRDIFTVSTGGRPCTVTRARGRVDGQGEYVSGKLVFETLPFLPPYPSAQALQGLAVPEGAITVKPVLAAAGGGGLTPEFGKWLLGQVRGQRVLFVGESHWNGDANRLCNRMVEELLARGGLRAVFLELNYSHAAFFNHYIRERDDGLARRFFRQRVHHLVGTPSLLELLHILRRWNQAHPDRSVRVGCVDMEWNAARTMGHILRPYLRRVRPGFVLSESRPALRSWAKGIPPALKSLLAEARAKKTVGEYPFITPAYIDQVVTNLHDTLSIRDQRGDRQRHIIRNIGTFQGDLLEEGLVLFKGGSYHAIKRRVDKEDYWRDAAWLHQVHPATRGRVRTLRLCALGYCFADLVGRNPAAHMPSATMYNDFVRSFQEALAQGGAARDDHYLLGGSGPGLFDKLLIQAGYSLGVDVLRVGPVDWKRLVQVHGQAVQSDYFRSFDANVYILRGRMEVTRPLVLAGE